MTLSIEQLEGLERLLAKAAPRPWSPGAKGNGKPGYVYSSNSLGSAVAIVYGEALQFTAFSQEMEEAHGELISAAVNALPALITAAKAHLGEDHGSGGTPSEGV